MMREARCCIRARFSQDCSLDARREEEYPPDREPPPDEGDALSEDTGMTLCMAAIADDDGEPRIVLCTDWKSESPLGVTETTDKMKWLQRPGWVVMKAGIDSHAGRMIRRFKAFFRDKEITELNASDLIEQAVYDHAEHLRERYSRMTMGMSYAALREWATASPGLQQVQETLQEIKKVRAECSLIIAGFTKTKVPIICKIQQTSAPPWHETTFSDTFVAIGEGAKIATPSLYRRDYDADVPLENAIYQLFEAKVLAETMGSVGDATSLDVFYPNRKPKSLSDRGHEYLNELLLKYGPKPRIKKVDWEPRYLCKFELED